MKHVNEAISELLLRHNCVIIPSFGGFVANITASTINANLGTITPPKKALTFNTNLINNDGLLANYLASENNISFSEATAFIESQTTGWKNLLKNGQRLELEKVGYLYLDEEDNLNFEQDRFFNLLLSSFGLETVQFITEEKIESVTAPIAVLPKAKEETPFVAAVEETRSPLTEETTESETVPVVSIEQPKQKKKAYWKYAAAAVFIPIAFYSFWIPMNTDVLQSGILLKDDFNPFGKKAEVRYERNTIDLSLEVAEPTTSLQEHVDGLPNDVRYFSYNLDEYKYVQVALRHQELPEVTTDLENSITTPVVAEPIVGNRAKIHLIAGCFGSKANAENLVQQLTEKGYTAFILDKNKGLYRVTAAQGNTKSSIKQLRSKLNESGFTSWILSL